MIPRNYFNTISKRIFLVAACILYAFTVFSNDDKGKDKKYNVLFIMVDDLRPNLACYGDKKAITPNIDKLARRGTMFKNAYCQQAVCNPSRASILTGLRPNQNGVTDLITHFRDKVPGVATLPQAFKNNGYTAVGVGKIFHDTKSTVDTISWSPVQSEIDEKKGKEYFLERNKKGGKADAYEFTDRDDASYPDGKVADQAVELLRRFKNSGESFFLAAGFRKPHLPFCAPQKYWDMYAHTAFPGVENRNRPIGAPEIAFHQGQELRGYTDIPDEGPLAAGKEKDLIRAYYACISFADAQVGKVLDELNRLGLSDNTIVVLVGDHGYHLGEQDLWCKSTNFELDARVPLIISVPKASQKNGGTDAIVEAVDIYPTLTALCKIDPAPKLSGTSLVPLLQNPAIRWDRVAYSQFARPYKALFSKTATHMGYSVRDREWRYTVWYNLSGNAIENKELYYLGNGGIEKENLSGTAKYQPVEKKLGELLETYRNIQ
ncbi:sulfatase [Chitinophaga sp. GCM10012297]|uniref:Sulfatase n=1 Tax=Chitinophaga chungangae TaxID=2821488 RepID=A0ABS3YA16_9BACT|nr:sulfatase [Chitinophaga chungangae]MBO9151530.1 sulfatase [Chitinophaga chungangae]